MIAAHIQIILFILITHLWDIFFSLLSIPPHKCSPQSYLKAKIMPLPIPGVADEKLRNSRYKVFDMATESVHQRTNRRIRKI